MNNELRIGMETEHELKVRKRRKRIHDKLDDIVESVDLYEASMKEKGGGMFVDSADPEELNLSKLWRIGMEQYVQCYRGAVRSDKEVYCELLECLEKQGQCENDIQRVQTQIEAIDCRLKHLKRPQGQQVTS